MGIDIFWPYSFDPDTALTDFHAGPVKREKPHSGTISIDENLKGAKNIQGFKPVEYDDIDIQTHLIEHPPLRSLYVKADSICTNMDSG